MQRFNQLSEGDLNMMRWFLEHLSSEKMEPENFYLKSPENLISLAQKCELTVFVFLIN